MCRDGQGMHFRWRKPPEQRLNGSAGVGVVGAGAGSWLVAEKVR